MNERCSGITLREWMKRHPVLSQLNDEVFEEAHSRIKRFGLALHETSGYHPMTHIESMDDEDVETVLRDIGHSPVSHKAYNLMCEALAALDDAHSEAEPRLKNELYMVWRRLDELAKTYFLHQIH